MAEQHKCDEHSGVCKEVDFLKESARDLWTAIDGMRRLMYTVLGSIIVTMIGVIVQLGLSLGNRVGH